MVCGWVVVPDCDGWDAYPEDVRERALLLASSLMWAATGRRYGGCPVTVQPSRQVEAPPLYRTYPLLGLSGHAGWHPYIRDGAWFNPPMGGGCSPSTCEVVLQGPVSGVTAVRLSGTTVDPSTYALMDGYRLVRTDGGCWPACVNYANQDPPAFEVDYLQGETVPADVVAATGMLACEYAKELTGGECGLTQQVTSISRQGVSFEVAEIDPQSTAIATGIRLVDQVIRTHNPRGLTSRPRVFSPDLPYPRRVT